MFLLIVYVLDLIIHGDPRAEGVRVLLMTATPRGAAFSTLESVLNKMGASMGSVTLTASESYKQFSRIPLWKVVEKPEQWQNLSQHEKVIDALILMTEWLWRVKYQTASILIFVAGESEVLRMRNAILFSEKLISFGWSYAVSYTHLTLPTNREV